MAYVSRLKTLYDESGKSVLMERFGYTNPMSVPAIKKIVVSMSMKDAITDSKLVDQVVADLMVITGQKPVVTKAKKSIAAFKLREGMPIGCSVTLRKSMMYDFIDRLVNIALPRVKDFKGISAKQFDGRGNFSMGLKEQIVFPEINYDKIDKIRGMNITIVTSAKTNDEAKALLEFFNFPLN
jgi:large subunit ribosomal protein L5